MPKKKIQNLKRGRPKKLTMKEGLEKLKDIKRQRIEVLQQFKEYQEHNPIYYFDTPPNPGPNPRQRDIIEAWLDTFYKTFTFTGGERSGKTTILTLIGISTMIGEYPWDNMHSRKGAPTKLSHLFPHNKPRKVRYIGQDWKEHIQDVVIPALEQWWPKDRAVKRKGNGIIPDAEWIDVKTGSSLTILSNNQKPRVHRGWHGDLILYDEPPDKEIYIANARGLVDRRGREFIAATLLEEPWIHQEIVNKRLADGRPDPMVFNTHIMSKENVGYGITQEGLDEYANKLSDSELKSRLEGVPVHLQGLIYPEFKRKVHLKERAEIRLNWLVDVLVDVHPMERQAILFVATDEWNRKWLVDEVWGNGDGTWVGEQVVRMVQRRQYRVNRVAVDPLSKGDKNNPNTVFDKIRAVLWKYGYDLETASKDKNSGILETKSYLRGVNGEPALFIFNDLVRTIFEIEGYMWEMKDGKPTGKAMDKDDHMMENLYRAIMLGTKYFDEEEIEDEIYDTYNTGKSAIGGY